MKAQKKKEVALNKEEVFIVKLKLDTDKYQEDYLNEMFENVRMFSNKLVKSIKKRYGALTAKPYFKASSELTIYYHEAINTLKKAIAEIDKIDKPSKEDKRLKKQAKAEVELFKKELTRLNSFKKEWQKEYNIVASKYVVSPEATILRNTGSFRYNIPSNICGVIADNVSKSIEKLLFGNGKDMHFKKYGELNYITGAHLNSDIVFNKEDLTLSVFYTKSSLNRKRKHPNQIRPKPTIIPIHQTASYPDAYRMKALENELRYSGISREITPNGYQYFAVLTLKGKIPYAMNKDGSSRYNNPIDTQNKVGIDIGLSTIAVYSKKGCIFTKIGGDEIERIDEKIATIQRYLQRSIMASNPDAYNEVGEYIPGKSLKNRSKGYYKAIRQIKALYARRKASLDNWQHRFANELIDKYGNQIYIEDMDFQDLAKRCSEDKYDPITGRALSKKRFGKSLLRYSPASLVKTIEAKAKRSGGQLIKINQYEVKPSQFNHMTGLCTKKTLDNRINHFPDGKVAQRDLYSAFIIAHVKPSKTGDYKIRDVKGMKKDFDVFMENHNKVYQEVQKDEGIKNIFGLDKGDNNDETTINV